MFNSSPCSEPSSRFVRTCEVSQTFDFIIAASSSSGAASQADRIYCRSSSPLESSKDPPTLQSGCMSTWSLGRHLQIGAWQHRGGSARPSCLRQARVLILPLHWASLQPRALHAPQLAILCHQYENEPPGCRVAPAPGGSAALCRSGWYRADWEPAAANGGRALGVSWGCPVVLWGPSTPNSTRV